VNTRLTWICHGATAASRAALFPLDEPLEEKAREAARSVPTLSRADRVLSSPARRAVETAALLGLDAQIDDELRDCGYGRWAGRSIMQIGGEEPEALSLWMSDPQAAPHGGESLAALRDRVAGWLSAQSALGGHVIAISHAPVIRAAVVHVLVAPLSSFWLSDIEPFGALRMTNDGRRWSLRF
jgi:broad specificity phosphatase PhoE